MKHPVYTIFISLMIAGNLFGIYQLIVSQQEFMVKYPKLVQNNYPLLVIIPLINILALTGMLFFKSWAPYLVIIGSAAVIVADIYFGIKYHIPIAAVSAILILFFIVKYWNQFK